jgi:putative SOS response-associated peptidase YedK
MCAGVELKGQDKTFRIYFPVPEAQLPVLRRDGSELMLTWGARGGEHAAGHPQIRWPQGGWARLESIRSGRWDRFAPQSVKIPARGFMEKDADGKSHWFKLDAGQFLQGLIAHVGEERRVYIVTVKPPPERAHIHDRWPRIVSGKDLGT